MPSTSWTQPRIPENLGLFKGLLYIQRQHCSQTSWLFWGVFVMPFVNARLLGGLCLLKGGEDDPCPLYFSLPSWHSLREGEKKETTCKNTGRDAREKARRRLSEERVGQKVSAAARDTVGNVAWKCPASCSSVIPLDTPLHAETWLGYECMTGWRRFFFFFFFFISLVLSRYLSLSLYTVYNTSSLISPVHPAHTLSPKPLAVINPSIVTVTAEHASYACLFGVEELITSSQQGPYRQQYMWCACDTMSKIHANAPCYELHCWMVWQHTHIIAGEPRISRWNLHFTQEPCYGLNIQIKRQTWFLLIALHSYIFSSGIFPRMKSSWALFKWCECLNVGSWCHLWKWHISTQVIGSDIGLEENTIQPQA